MEQVQYGDPRVSHRLWQNLDEDPETSCWVYLGARFTPTGWPIYSHQSVWRVLYRRLVGPVPPEVSMLCDLDAKGCMNPYHRLSPYGNQVPPHVCPVCQRAHMPDLTTGQ